LHLQPIVYVTNMERSLTWYRRLLNIEPTMTSDHWSSFNVDGATLALHHSGEAQGNGDVELSLVVEDLNAHAERLGVDQMIDQPFGRSFTVTDPDGAAIQVNEHHE